MQESSRNVSTPCLSFFSHASMETCRSLCWHLQGPAASAADLACHLASHPSDLASEDFACHPQACWGGEIHLAFGCPACHTAHLADLACHHAGIL